MYKIYKYELKEGGFPQQLLMVRGAEFLNFRYQHSLFGEGPVIWALVPDDLAPDDTEIRTFILHFTGDTVQDNEFYLGSDISQDGLVWHLFEIRG